MKTIKTLTTFLFVLISMSLMAEDNVIFFNAQSSPALNWTECEACFADSSRVNISSTGEATYNSVDGTVDWVLSTVDVTHTGAMNKNFSLLYGGISYIDISAPNFLSTLVPGGIDRSNGGDMGVRSPNNKGGINQNEGIWFGLDLSEFPSSVSVQITKLRIASIKEDRAGLIVNLDDTDKSLTFGASGSGMDVETSGTSVDVSSFDMILKGGQVNKSMMAIIGTTPTLESGFRVTGVEVKISENIENVINLVPLAGGSEGSTRYVDESELLISAAGVVSYNNSNSVDDWIVSSSEITYEGAQDKTFSIHFGAMGTTDMTEGANYGNLLTPAGIDRAASGDMGVRGGAGNGIDNGEGFWFGLDLSNFMSSVEVKITKISVASVQAGDTLEFISRANTAKRLVLDYPVNDGTAIDISSLDLTLAGGQKDTSMFTAIYNSTLDGGASRIVGLELTFSEATVTELHSVKSSKMAVSISPNPFQDNLSIAYNALHSGAVKVQMLSLNGQELLCRSFNLSEGNNNFSLDASSLNAGMYFCVTSSQMGVVTTKVIKK